MTEVPRWSESILSEPKCISCHDIKPKSKLNDAVGLSTGIPSAKVSEQVCKHYAEALVLATRCGPDAVLSLVTDFDQAVGEAPVRPVGSAYDAAAALLRMPSLTATLLEAAWRLSRRIGEPASQRTVQQEICLNSARTADSNTLIVRLLERCHNGSLTQREYSEILCLFLQGSPFDDHPWRDFLSSFSEDLLPRLPEVYAVLGRFAAAADLAEESGRFAQAFSYLKCIPGSAAALRAMVMAERIGDQALIREAHQMAGACLWREQQYADALAHFQHIEALERVSDCHWQLGQYADAIRHRPTCTADWKREVRAEVDKTVRSYLDTQEYCGAIRLLQSVREAWRAHTGDTAVDVEIDRTARAIADLTKTARAFFDSVVRETHAQPGAPVFKEWSLLEEAAGNYPEAAALAEKAHDFFTASLLYEQAGAYGKALVALGQDPHADLARKAQLLQESGDFSQAGRLYEALGELDKALVLYEHAEEFARAAELRRQQVGDSTVLFDDRFLDLLHKANRLEDLTVLCEAQLKEAGVSREARLRVLERLKKLGARGFVGETWLERVASELSAITSLEHANFDRGVAQWRQTALNDIVATYLDAFGLDLGTSNSVVALYNKRTGQPEVVEHRGRQLIPSIFAIDRDGQEIVGLSRSELFGKAPRAIVTGAKRVIGTDTQFRAGGQLYRPEEISARVISHAQNLAKDYLSQKVAEKIAFLAAQDLGKDPPEHWVTDYLAAHPLSFPLDKGVITVPAYFNELQKQATRTAGQLASVTVLRLLHEPTAACLSFRVKHTAEESVLVVDLGAGTLDLSLVRIAEGVFEVDEIEGDSTLGSADIDDILYAHFAEQIRQENGWDLTKYPEARTRLRQACEDLKIALSAQASWTIELPYFIDENTVRLPLTRNELITHVAPWLVRLQTTCKKIKGRFDRVVLIGGGALMPAVHQHIRDVVHQHPQLGLDPMTAVARGAVTQAAILSGVEKNVLILDAVPFSLGIRVRATDDGGERLAILIPKHTTIPTHKAEMFTTTRENQTVVDIEVFQGESEDLSHAMQVGEFRLDGILPAKAGVPHIEVIFAIDANCLLVVTAHDTATNRREQIYIKDVHLLTPAQITIAEERFQRTQEQRECLRKLETMAVALTALLDEGTTCPLLALQKRFHDRLGHYENHPSSYTVTAEDGEQLVAIYREHRALDVRARLLLDRWDTVHKSAEAWKSQCKAISAQSGHVVAAFPALLNEGDSLIRRVREAVRELHGTAETYGAWLGTLETLPLNLSGSPDDLARHFLHRSRYTEAFAQFRRLALPLTCLQVELGLEILARQRDREAYEAFLRQHAAALAMERPDFTRLHRSVQHYAPSLVWIQCHVGAYRASGSGFFVGPSTIATNRHVVMDESNTTLLSPEHIEVLTTDRRLRIQSIHTPPPGNDDVALLRVAEEPAPHKALRLGFSELVQVGEPIMVLGFPNSPDVPDLSHGGFGARLYCNVGIVNKIVQHELSTARMLEVSFPLRGGISGAPILNELGEVIGLATFAVQYQRNRVDGGAHVESSFYAIPVEALRRLSGVTE